MPGVEIVNGAGVKRSAEVDAENRLVTRAISSPLDEHINEESGKVWSLALEGVNPTAADDYIFYLKNTGEKDIRITDFRLAADTAATQIEIHKVSGIAAGGTAISPVSRNLGSASTPTATIESGADITGLTDDGTLFFMQLAVVNTDYHLRTSSNIIVTKGSAIAISVETGTANITGIISIVEAE